MTATVLEYAPEAQAVTDNWVIRIMQGGVLVNLRIRRWGGRTKLIEDDLGLDTEGLDEATLLAHHTFFRLGSKLLLPRYIVQSLNSIETMGRRNLKENAIKIWAGLFVPVKTYGRFKERHEELRAQYLQLRDEIVAQLDTIKATMEEEYSLLAFTAWERLHPNSGPAPTEFVRTYVERVIEKFPQAEDIRESFVFDFVPRYVPLPSQLAEDAVRAQELYEEQSATAEERRLRQAMQNDVLRHWGEQKREMIDSFLADVVGQIRGQVYGVVADAVKTMERNDGTLPGKTAEGLKSLMDTIRALDPYGDGELETAFTALEAHLATPAPLRDQAELKEQLDALCTLTRATLVTLDRLPRKAKADEIIVPTLDEVRQARAVLGIETVVPVVEMALARTRREL